MIPPLPVAFNLQPIPRVLHQVWVGPADPMRARAIFDLWTDELPDTWQTVLWTEQAIRDTPIEPYWRAIKPLSEDPRLLADLLRLVIVGLYGGVYTDSDAVPLSSLEEWVGARNGWIGTGPETQGSPTLINAAFGAPAGHPFLSRVLMLGQAALLRGVTNPHWVAGPRQFRAAYSQAQDMDVSYDFVTTVDAAARAMVRGDRPIDLGWMRSRWPESPILHVVLR